MTKEKFHDKLYDLIVEKATAWWHDHCAIFEDEDKLINDRVYANVVNDFYNDKLCLPCMEKFNNMWDPADNGFDGTMDEESIWYDFENDEAGPAIESWFNINGPKIMPDIIKYAMERGRQS